MRTVTEKFHDQTNKPEFNVEDVREHKSTAEDEETEEGDIDRVNGKDLDGESVGGKFDVSQDASEKESQVVLKDPIRWFGILVPPALRSAQSTFTDAVQNLIPSLAAVVAEMRNFEIEIARLRKKIAKKQKAESAAESAAQNAAV